MKINTKRQYYCNVYQMIKIKYNDDDICYVIRLHVTYNDNTWKRCDVHALFACEENIQDRCYIDFNKC